MTENIRCECCSNQFERPVGRRGRPRLYCDDDCKELVARLAQLETLIERKMSGPGSFDPGAASALRGQLWSMANRANALGRPAPSRYRAANRAAK